MINRTKYLDRVQAGLRGLVVIDEAQRCPQIFPVFRMLVDREDNAARFLILGSASPELSRQAAELLAGRVEIIEMGGFDLGELSAGASHGLWLREMDAIIRRNCGMASRCYPLESLLIR